MRGAAFARCTVGDVSFTVAASHLATDDGERDSQAQRLDAELAAIAGPVMLGIDANETAAGASWKRLAAGRVDVGAAQDQPTFSATNPKRRIDGIFVTPDMTVESFQVISSEATRSASDHLPLVADVIVPS